MPRHPRIVVPGFPHHITQRGNGRQDVFLSDADRLIFLEVLAEYSVQYHLTVWGYCLMTNHFHLVAVPQYENSVARALGRLEADYARYFNVRRQTPGHLWQARFYSVPMELPYCWRALAYVERNPLRAGIVSTAQDFRWSSAAARLGAVPSPRWLELDEWKRCWTYDEWACMLENDSEEALGVQLREATLGGHPLGERLTGMLEMRLGRRLAKGKAGRPNKSGTTVTVPD